MNVFALERISLGETAEHASVERSFNTVESSIQWTDSCLFSSATTRRIESRNARMHKRIMLAALWAFVLSPVGPAAAESQPLERAYKTVGGGATVPCGRFVLEVDKGPQADFSLLLIVTSWVQGYLTAYNATLSKSPEIAGDLSKGMTDVELLDWIAEYCSANRDETIASAAHEMTIYLFRLASSGYGTH